MFPPLFLDIFLVSHVCSILPPFVGIKNRWCRPSANWLFNYLLIATCPELLRCNSSQNITRETETTVLAWPMLYIPLCNHFTSLCFHLSFFFMAVSPETLVIKLSVWSMKLFKYCGLTTQHLDHFWCPPGHFASKLFLDLNTSEVPMVPLQHHLFRFKSIWFMVNWFHYWASPCLISSCFALAWVIPWLICLCWLNHILSRL